MKKAYWCILALVMLPVASNAISDDLDIPHITVYGTATIQVTPNQMIWLLNVRNIDPSSAGAAKTHEKRLEAVLSFLRQNQIAKETIQTSRMQLGENWKFARNERTQDGYFASTDVQFTLADLTKYSSLWIGLSEIEGVQLNAVLLEHSERIKFQNEARAKAVLAAIDKAKAIAETMGARIEKPLVVEEDVTAVEGYRTQVPILSNSVSSEVRTAGTSIDSGQSVAPGSIPIRVRVKAIFGLPKK